ncbi:hypothetical protein [Heyndrickxia oleronia]|uniref:hypothetical protein n=1 Tax=Heyndrickxia oleronia TaxID=38875 RepID=UPI001C0EF688|nr:hypothetical protein [Heyndrickxia oleronia]MBU5213248.1 hypothetical protein [Heyndrickxia oleronia]
MDTFVESKVFNPNLLGKAVRIKGFDVDGHHWDRLFLVKDINGSYISLVNDQGEETEKVHMENFEYADEALKIKVLEEKE